MKRIGTSALCLLVALMAFVAVDLTIHAGDVGATSVTKQAISLLKNRYGITSTPEEINILDGATLTVTELNYVDGVTSAIQTQLDAKTGTSLADAKAYVGNAGTALAQSITLINDVTGTMINTGVINATIPASTITSSMIAIANVTNSDLGASAVTSDKIAIANVQASDMFLNTVTATVAAGQTGADITVEASSILVDTQPISGFSNLYTLTKSDFAGGVWSINTDAHPVAMVMNGVFIRP